MLRWSNLILGVIITKQIEIHSDAAIAISSWDVIVSGGKWWKMALT